MKRKLAKLNYDGKEIDLPVIIGSENEDAIDISKIRSETGLITLDKGFKNTGSTTSKITYLDGEKGILRHRGYSIEDLASKSTFTEVCYLLLYGELPKKNELESIFVIFLCIITESKLGYINSNFIKPLFNY